MIKRLFYLIIFFIGGIYYLQKNNYINLTEKAHTEMREGFEIIKEKSKTFIKEGIKVALREGSDIAKDAMDEMDEEKRQ